MKRANQRKQTCKSDEPAAKRKKMPWSISVPTASNEALPLPIPLLSLNYDCLLVILSHLSIDDLMNMCIASDLLKDAILNCDLRKRKFDFDDESCSCDILSAFKIFGQQMTDIKISTLNLPNNIDEILKFDEILRLISTHCSMDTIKHLDIEYYKGSRIKKRLLYNALPFFRQLESFAVSETDGHGRHVCLDYHIISPKYNKAINDFIERVLMQAVNISAIQLNSVKVTGRFTHLPLTNLEILKFIGCNVQNSLSIFSYLETKPNLVQFTWINSSVRGVDDLLTNSSDHIFELVTNNVLGLKTFEYNQNEMYISHTGKIKMHSIYNDSNLELIGNFLKLEKLAIQTGAFRVNTFDELRTILKKRGTVKKLSTYPHLLYNKEVLVHFPVYHLPTDYEDFK